MQFLGDEEYSNTRIFDRRKSDYSNSGSQCHLSPLPHILILVVVSLGHMLSDECFHTKIGVTAERDWFDLLLCTICILLDQYPSVQTNQKGV